MIIRVEGVGVIADQLDPSFCLEYTLFLFMSNKKPLPFLLLFLFAICPPLFLRGGRLYPILATKDIIFLCVENNMIRRLITRV